MPHSIEHIMHEVQVLATVPRSPSGKLSLNKKTTLKISCDKDFNKDDHAYRRKRRWHLISNGASIIRVIWDCVFSRFIVRQCSSGKGAAISSAVSDPPTLIILSNLKEKDAVGLDTMMIYRALHNSGVRVYIYAAAFDADLVEMVVSKQKMIELINDPDTCVLYQYCGYWAFGNDILKAAKGKAVLRYHNVTPASYFLKYNLSATVSCLLGRMLIKKIVESGRVDFYLPASSYNASELQKWAGPKKLEGRLRVISPLSPHLCQDEEGQYVQVAYKKNHEDSVKILVVGRVVPNKGHVHVIETLKSYVARFGNNVHCVVVGKRLFAFKSYLKYLEKQINISGLSRNFSFISNIPAQEMVQRMRESDVLLMLSEHEGFCVPIIEAQAHGLPVICLNRGAMKESVGANQLCFDEVNYDLIAASVYHVSHDETSRRFLIDSGLNNSAKYSPDKLQKELVHMWKSEF